MKVIIAGTRSLSLSIEEIQAIVDASGFEVTEVVSGGNGQRLKPGGRLQGVDLCGERWARSKVIPIKRFNPDWNTHGNAAGPIRNGEMAKYGDALIAVWNGKSVGTKSMIREMSKAHGQNAKVYIHSV